MAIQYIQPGKPNQNAYIERFNRTLREELLDQHLFARLHDVREAIYWWIYEDDSVLDNGTRRWLHRFRRAIRSPAAQN